MTTSNLSTASAAAQPGDNQQGQQQYAVFADFNSVSFEARVQHTEIKAGAYGEFVAVTLITNLKDGERGAAIRFNSDGAALKLAKGGNMMPGRRVMVTGKIVEVRNSYTNNDGLVIPLDRQQIQLQRVQLQLGAVPAKYRKNAA